MLGSQNPQLTALWAMDPARARRYVIGVLESVNGNVSKAAEKMSMSRRAVTRWIAQNSEIRYALDGIRTRARTDHTEET
jgi:ABC-type proline/glycine betaine transport system permease subunit